MSIVEAARGKLVSNTTGRRPAEWSVVPVRLVVGAFLLAHSLARFGLGPRTHRSIAYFAFLFQERGLPAPELIGWAITLLQLVAGLLILLGVLTRVGGLLAAVAMGWMTLLVYLPNGFRESGVNIYLTGTIALLGLALALWGNGLASVERLLFDRDRRPLAWLLDRVGAEAVRDRLAATDLTAWGPVPARFGVAIVGLYEGLGRFGIGLLGRPVEPHIGMAGVGMGLESIPLVPATPLMAQLVTLGELGCSVLLILGLFTRYSSLVLVGLLGGAAVINLGHGYGGTGAWVVEALVTPTVAAVGLALSGSGRLSLERYLLGRECSVEGWVRSRLAV